MKYLKIFIAIGLLTAMNACDQDRLYEDELYKQVVSLICSDNYNVLEDTQELTGQEIVSYVAASCGGTGAPEKDIRISIIEDDEALDVYNWSMYDAETQNYAKRLPISKYDIEDHHIVIPKGERSGKMKITFRPEGLSPDTAYFLPLSIASMSAYELNSKKSNVMYRVLIKNKYAVQYSSGFSEYKMNGFRGETAIVMTKPMYPLTQNKVRLMAGNMLADDYTFEEGAIVLEVSGDNKVSIIPYKEGGTLSITQMDGDSLYPNTFKIVNDWDKKFKVFHIHYKYKAGSAAEVEMREELRMEFED